MSESQGWLEPKDQHKCECGNKRKRYSLTPVVKGSTTRYYVCAKCDAPVDLSWSCCPYCECHLDWSNKP